jgi:DNA modification methylase
VALLHGRDFTGIELNPEYAAMARKRIGKFDVHGGPLFQELA